MRQETLHSRVMRLSATAKLHLKNAAKNRWPNRPIADLLSYGAGRPWIDKGYALSATSYHFDDALAREAFLLMHSDWTKWWNLARLPHEKFIVEFNPNCFDTHQGRDYRRALAFDGEIISVLTLNAAGTLLFAPYQARMTNDPPSNGWFAPPFDAMSVGRSPQVSGLPPLLVARQEDWAAIFDATGADARINTGLTVGDTMMVIAALSILNVRSGSIEYVSRPSTRAIIKGESRRSKEATLLVIRPDATSAQYAGSAEDSGHETVQKRRHEVRGHIRTLRSGKRVWVRPHQRGDESLGQCRKRRLVEFTPTIPEGRL